MTQQAGDYHAEMIRRHWQGTSMRELGRDYGTSHGYVASVIASFRRRHGLDRLRPLYTLTPCATCYALVAAKAAHPPVFCAECTSKMLLTPAEPAESEKS